MCNPEPLPISKEDVGPLPNSIGNNCRSSSLTTGTSTETETTETAKEEDGATARVTTTAFKTKKKTSYLKRHLTPPDLSQHMPSIDPKTAKIVWRDFWFLVLGCVALSVISYVETHASDPEARVSVKVAGLVNTRQITVNPSGIVDTGFILTQPLYEWLRDNRDWNDILAAINSLVLVFPSLYLAYVTIWKGDYSLSFRVISVQLLRAFCGWFTYLPPDPTYLNSYFDFPDIVHCLFQECAGQTPQVMPFVSFFSGHVATMVVVGNHMWLSGHVFPMATLVHFLNALQILRLLATRGHYSIDIIIGWYVAVYVSNPAGRLGRYYSRGTNVQEIMPKTPTEAFEHMTGVADARNESRMSALLRRQDVQEVLMAMQDNLGEDEQYYDDFHSETTARILQETTAKLLQERATLVQQRVDYMKQQGHEKINYMKQQGQERMSYLQQQAHAVVERYHSGYSSASSEEADDNDGIGKKDR